MTGSVFLSRDSSFVTFSGFVSDVTDFFVSSSAFFLDEVKPKRLNKDVFFAFSSFFSSFSSIGTADV